MGFFDSLKGLSGATRTSPSSSSEPRHADRDAPEETPAEPHISGGKHAARD